MGKRKPEFDHEDEAVMSNYVKNLFRAAGMTQEERQALFVVTPEFFAAYDELLQFFLGMAGPNGEDPVLGTHLSGLRIDVSFDRERESLLIVPVGKARITAKMLRELKDELVQILTSPSVEITDKDFF